MMNFLALALVAMSICDAAESETYSIVSQRLGQLIDRVNEGALTISEALLSIDERDIDILIKSSVIHPDQDVPIAEAQCVCTGAVQGVLCFDLRQIDQFKNKNVPIIWVTDTICNDDLCLLKNVSGIFALREDPSSHAAIVVRGFNIPCLTFPQQIQRDDRGIKTLSGRFEEGALVTLDGFNGKLFEKTLPLHHPNNTLLLDIIMGWAEKYAKLSVHGNADTPDEVKEALHFGAKGVDPRTEHMFFHPEHLNLFRKVVLSNGEIGPYLETLKNQQKKDFIELYQTMKSFPVKIRLLDPPLHEFFSISDSCLEELAKDLQVTPASLQKKLNELHEVNPMMGHRGIRLLLTRPEILKMQVQAIFEAAADSSLIDTQIEPYIILPMVISEKEISFAKKLIDEVCDEVSRERHCKIVYHLGAMMETPRACFLAGTIAKEVDFISFGTNDLTGQTLALSRGDVYDKFLKYYFEKELLPSDPFSHLDLSVCQLMKIAVDQVRTQKRSVSIGLCGEHGSEKAGVLICHELGLDTVSCVPFRIPSVKLFAAQAAILESVNKRI